MVHLISIVMRFCAMLVVVALIAMPSDLYAQNAEINISKGWEEDPPRLSSLIDFTKSESNFRIAVKRYVEDKASIKRRYEVLLSPVRHKRLRAFHRGWQKRLKELDFETLHHEGQIDYNALSNHQGPLISESGIKTKDELLDLNNKTSIKTFLIGESLLKNLSENSIFSVL